MIKQIVELTLPELTLAMARHEIPDADWDYVIEVNGVPVAKDEYGDSFVLSWQTMGPLWEREADNLSSYFSGNYKTDKNKAWWANAHHYVSEKMDKASRTPESIARALLTMWYPQGIELEAV